MAVKQNVLSMVALVLTCSVFCGTSMAQLGALTIGVFLDNEINHVGGVINSAANAGNTVLAGAGGQILQALLAAKAAYADSLDKTQAQLIPTQISLLNDLATKVQTLERGTVDQIREIADKGAVFGNVMPFSNRFPQVTRYSPYFVVTVGDGTQLVSAFGNFFDVAREGYDPTLTLGLNTIKTITKNTLQLSFAVPNASFPSASSAVQFNRARLTVPYQESCFVISKCQRKATFDLMLVSLPKTAGKIRFHTKTPVSQRQIQPQVGPSWRQESDHDDIPDPIASGKQHCVNVTPGWQVDVNTVVLNVEWQEGDWIDKGNASNIANACWNIATVHHGTGTSGKVHFHLSWTEYRFQDVIQAADQDKDLAWGTSTKFDVPARGTWDAEYIQFDNRIQSVNSSTFSSPYIRAETVGNQVTIVTVP